MTWLHHLTGFQLFVVASLYDVSFWSAEARFERDHRIPPAITMLTAGISSAFISIWWLIYAAWPVIT